MSTHQESIPTGCWIHVSLREFPRFIGFTYVDSEAGLSAKGDSDDKPDLAESPGVTLRLPLPGVTWRVLSEAELAQKGLPAVPSWVVEFYGPQPAAGTLWGTWRHHAKLVGRFAPDFPDDLQVIVHDGGPRVTQRHAELVWVRVTGCEGDIFQGRVLNQPHQLLSVSAGSAIQFLVPDGGEHPILTTAKYLSERPNWLIEACSKCGLTELFDAPSDLIKIVFPGVPEGAVMSAFTAFCSMCGGVQVVQLKNEASEIRQSPAPTQPAKKWWQFWKND